jgi:hypothetical protein
VEFTGEFQEYRRKSVVVQAGREAPGAREARGLAGFSRRKFFVFAGVSLAGLFLPKFVAGKVLLLGVRTNIAQPELLYPPVDLSYFDTPIGWRA